MIDFTNNEYQSHTRYLHHDKLTVTSSVKTFSQSINIRGLDSSNKIP